jgi:hypothetical protein
MRYCSFISPSHCLIIYLTKPPAQQSSQTPATPSKRMKLNSDAGSPSPKPAAIGATEEDFDPDVIQKMLVQIKCLNICRNMLERSEEVRYTKKSPLFHWIRNTHSVIASSHYKKIHPCMAC